MRERASKLRKRERVSDELSLRRFVMNLSQGDEGKALELLAAGDARDYKGILTRFVRAKISAASWNRRRYIDDLMLLERFISCGVHGSACSLHFHQLKNRYHREYGQILKELKPDLLAREEQERISQEPEARLFARKLETLRNEKEAKSRKSWVEMGGRLTD